eukprot:7335771-Lingulodinium_polyedra.AAC.1
MPSHGRTERCRCFDICSEVSCQGPEDPLPFFFDMSLGHGELQRKVKGLLPVLEDDIGRR